MYAVFLEVNVPDETMVEQARTNLPEQAVPMAKEMGGKGGYWLAPLSGHGHAVILFDDEAAAQKAAGSFEVGKEIGPVAGVTLNRLAVREVLASF